MGTTVGAAAPLRAGAKADLFYFRMALGCVAVAFLGFAPTYWMPLATGAFKANPIVHVHGLTFFAWTLFYAYQTRLAASGQVGRHRSVGLIGVSFATAMTIFGTLIAINSMRMAATLGMADAGKAFAIVPLSSIALFAVLVGAALVNVRRPDWHKRLMLIAAISILDAPIARWFLVALAPPGAVGPPPVGVDIGPSVVAALLMLLAIAHDWRQRGRPHSAYLVAGGAFLAVKVLQIPISATAAWHAVAGGVMALAG